MSDRRAEARRRTLLSGRLVRHRPAYQRFFIRGLNGVRRHLEVAAIPIAGIQGDFLGAVALFWELSE